MDKSETNNTVLDDVQKKLNDSYAAWQNAIGQANQNAQERMARPDEPGTTYEDFLKGAMPAQPATVVDPKKERSRAMITNIADAINAVGGIVGAARGADVTPMAPLSAANQQRYDKLIAQRQAEQDAYNKGVMQAQSHAMSMAEAYRRKRQQEDAQAAALDQARVNQAKMDYDKASDDYNRIYRQQNDTESRAARDRQESRLWTQHQDDVDYRNAQGVRADRDDIEAHNKYELSQWTELPGGKFVRNADYPSFIESMYNELMSNSDIKAEIQKDYKNDIAKAEHDSGAKEKLHERIVRKYLGSSDVAKQAAEKLNRYGTPNLWTQENVGGQSKTEEKPATVPTPAPTNQMKPVSMPSQPDSLYASQYGYNGTYGSRIDTTKSVPTQTKPKESAPKQKKTIPGF